LYLRCCSCPVGRGLKCKSWPLFRQPPDANIFIGNKVNIGWRITLDVYPGAKLVIHDQVNLTQDVVISVTEVVEIGQETLIAEHVSIRDADHGFHSDRSIASQDLKCSTVNIGSDVWIGSGARILRGSQVKNGCVIAANAVVTRHTVFEDYSIYGGVPAKKIKNRNKSVFI
jgi:acetyltransferase-like isoleucine patch superfamily enzyme